MASTSRRFTVNYSQPRVSEPAPPGCKYIWEGLVNEYLLLDMPPLIQNIGSSVFATISRQVEVDSVIHHGKFEHLHHPKFDHFEWERRVRATDPQRRFWEPSDLLKGILAEEIENPEYEERLGLKVANSGFNHWVSLIRVFPGLPYESVKNWLLQARTPLIAKVPILVDYPELSNEPYIGIDWKTNYFLPFKNHDLVNGTHSTHTLLLVGVYEAQEDDQFKLNPGRAYYIYQNSFEEGLQDGKKDESLLGNGRSIMSAELVTEVSLSINLPTPAIVTQAENPWDPREVGHIVEHHGYVLEKRREGMRALGNVQRYSPLSPF